MSDAMQALLIRCARAEGNLEASDQARQAAEARVAELECHERCTLALTDAMTRWDWSHCTGTAEFIEQIDDTIAAKEQAEAKLAETEAEIAELKSSIHEDIEAARTYEKY